MTVESFPFLEFFRDSAVFKFSTSEGNNTAVVFFHGFPGDTGKNEDIAARLSRNLAVDCFVFHYRGLGESRGNFGFQSSIHDSIEFVRHLESKYSRLHIIAHSWGGLVALNVLRQGWRNVSRAILLAPFCLLPDEPVISAILEEFVTDQKQKDKSYSVMDLREDFMMVKQDLAPFSILKDLKFKDRTLVIQGTRDVVSLPEGSRQLTALSGGSIGLIEVDDHHWFEKREQLYNLVYENLRD